MTAAAPLVGRPLDYPEPQWPGGPVGPSPRQALAHQLAPHADELLYGGARGGGKTDYALAESMRRLHLVPGLQAVIFRRTFKELSGPGGMIPRLLARIPRHVGRYHAGEHVWRFTNGSTLTLSYLERLSDVQAWLGLELQLMVFDQVEQLDEETYRMVRTSLRAGPQLGPRMLAAGLRPAAIATANPGGRGHAWVKRRFVDPFPLGGQLFRASPSDVEPSPSVRVFVPARLADNQALERGDPGYRRRLEALPEDDRKAQLDGDWNVYKGARFATFSADRHVRELTLPGAAVPRGCGIDYGSDAPFVAVWGVLLADDLLYVYREVARRGLAPAEQAALVLACERPGERSPQRPLPTVLDPACWAASPDRPLPRTGGKAVRRSGPPPGSIAATYVASGLPVLRADNRRRDGAALIDGLLRLRPDGQPRLIVHPCCVELIDTVPALQRDPADPEDVAKGPTDHWYDALRYLAMSLLAARRGAGAGAVAPPASSSGRPVPLSPERTAVQLERPRPGLAGLRRRPM